MYLINLLVKCKMNVLAQEVGDCCNSIDDEVTQKQIVSGNPVPERGIQNPVTHLRWSFREKPLTIFTERSSLDVWLGSEHTSEP